MKIIYIYTYISFAFAEVADNSAVRFPTGVQSARFRSKLEASCVSSNTDDLEFNESVCLCMTIYTYIYYLPTPPLGQDMTQGQFFKRSLTGLNSEFSFSYTTCLTKAEEPSLSYYFPIAGGRIIGFIPFPRVLVLCEMQYIYIYYIYDTYIWECMYALVHMCSRTCVYALFLVINLFVFWRR